MKTSESTISDAFTHEIALFLDLPVPNFGLIWYKKGTEFCTIEHMFDRLDKNLPEHQRNSFSRMLKIPILLILEFIPNARKLSDVGSELSSKNTWGRNALTDMGRLVALDIFINNWDRLPFLWRKEEGNSGNFLFTSDPSRPIFGIDQHVTTIVPIGVGQQKLDEYLQKISCVIDEISRFTIPKSSKEKTRTSFSEIKSNVPILYSIVEYLKENNPEMEVSYEDFMCIVSGIIKGIISLTTLTKSKMEEIYNNLELEVNALLGRMVWGQDFNGKYGLKLVDIKFLEKILGKLEENKDLLFGKLNEFSKSTS